MDPRQTKQHNVLQAILGDACAELRDDATINGQLAAKDFRLALTSLIEAGDHQGSGPTFWWNLKKAAELLGLEDLYAPLRQRHLVAERAS